MRRGRLLTVALLALCLVGSASARAGTSWMSGWTRLNDNPADGLSRYPIDPDPYQRATRCLRRGTAQPGTKALQRWLEQNWRGVSWGIYRCEVWGPHYASLHAEGRALDWHLSVHNAADKRAAERLIHLLLAPDREGNPQALASRMGIEELIWNCHYWGTGATSFRKYFQCYTPGGKRKKHFNETLAHMDHIHIGLNWAGAKKRTSFWRHS